jgi:proline iminopeptidase
MRTRVVLWLAVTCVCVGCTGAPTVRRIVGASALRQREAYVDAGGGVRLYYRIVGAGRDTIVVLHGGPGFSLSYLAADLAPLAERHTLVFYDQRGEGRSTLVGDSASLDAQRFADDLEAVRRRLGLERLTLLGHSWGAAVAALYATRHPERVGRLVIVDGIPPRYAQFAHAFEVMDARRDEATRRRVAALRAAKLADPGDAAACRAYYAVWFQAAFADGGALRRSRGDFCAGSRAALVNKVRNVDRYTVQSLGTWDWRPALGAVTAPALVIHGTADFLPVEASREWAVALPNGRLLVLDGSGHFPYLEVPDRFFAAVETFLDGGWPAGSEAERAGDLVH